MKKRILFVDDEPLVLEGLRRTLRPMRQEWEMDFAESGAKALERLAATAYDVVISDMIMPGMDGAQLLRESQQRAPNTIRLILSGSTEQQHAVKCVGVAHQYLSDASPYSHHPPGQGTRRTLADGARAGHS